MYWSERSIPQLAGLKRSCLAEVRSRVFHRTFRTRKGKVVRILATIMLMVVLFFTFSLISEWSDGTKCTGLILTIAFGGAWGYFYGHCMSIYSYRARERELDEIVYEVMNESAEAKQGEQE